MVANPVCVGPRVLLRRPQREDCEAFLAFVRASQHLYRPWVDPPARKQEFLHYCDRAQSKRCEGFLICRQRDGAIAGVANLNEIVRGALQGASLGYYGNAALARQGYMAEGVSLLLDRAFRALRLHRVEASVQPDNERSKVLLQRLGFRQEGFSPKYIWVWGKWRDCERWGLLAEEWRSRPYIKAD